MALMCRCTAADSCGAHWRSSADLTAAWEPEKPSALYGNIPVPAGTWDDDIKHGGRAAARRHGPVG